MTLGGGIMDDLFKVLLPTVLSGLGWIIIKVSSRIKANTDAHDALTSAVKEICLQLKHFDGRLEAQAKNVTDLNNQSRYFDREIAHLKSVTGMKRADSHDWHDGR